VKTVCTAPLPLDWVLANNHPPKSIQCCGKMRRSPSVGSDRTLLQTCNVNFCAVSLAEHPPVSTGWLVAVTVIPNERAGQPFYRIWCDGTFAVYCGKRCWRSPQSLAVVWVQRDWFSVE